MKSFFQNLLLACLSLIVTLTVLEGGFRFISQYSKKPPQWSSRPSFYFAPEHTKTFQDYAYQTPKPENTFRIAVIGDSYTFAPYMQFTDTFPKILERMLRLNTPDDRQQLQRIEVINYGVPAYSTSHEVRSAVRALKDGADLIILQITLNDAEIKPYRPTGLNTTNDRFAAPTLTGFWSVLTHSKLAGFLLTRWHNAQTVKAYTNYFINLFEHPRKWKIFSKSVLKIRALCKKHNVKLVATVFPLFGLALDQHYPFKGITEKILTFLKDKDIPALDLFPAYLNIPLEILQVIPSVDRHPNEIAHRIAAEQIYLWLEKNSLIPETFLIKRRFPTRINKNFDSNT
ncbi:SGNH/GDSL hydrolase family protein [bacterium]|nr:SGNH/GDSL hydrolase family protein [bacterium]